MLFAHKVARQVTHSRIAPEMTFSEASQFWLASRRLTPGIASKAKFIRQNTVDSYKAYIDTLNLFFSDMRLNQIHTGHLRSYQEARVTGAPPFIRYRRPQDEWNGKGKTSCPATPKKCNQELGCLKTILTRAGCWTEELAENYEPFLEEVADIPQALTPDQQDRWLKACLMRQDWWIIYWYSELAFGTTMGTNEMRSLRTGDVNLAHEVVCVPDAGAKNTYRNRTIPLIKAETKRAAEQLLARARDLGSLHPNHYLFPFREKQAPFDPMKPMTVSGIKRRWNEVRSALGPEFAWFTPYDTRHTAITRWAESGMDMPTLMSMAGHVSERMTRHYTHISMQAKRRALAKIGPTSERGGNHLPYYMPGS